MGDRTDEVAALRAEVEHLRTLVGPSELDHGALTAAAQRAEVEVREAQAEVGRLRGQIAEMTVQLARARQEQEWALTGRPRWRVATLRLRRRGVSADGT